MCGVIIRRLAPPTIFVAPVVSGPTWLRCMGSVTRLAPRVDAGLRAWCAAARGVLAVLRLLFDVRAQPRRDCVTDAIVERSEGLPVAVMKWPRHRPVSARHRPGLALEELAPGDAARWTERMRLVLALSEPGVVAKAAHELLEFSSVWRNGAGVGLRRRSPRARREAGRHRGTARRLRRRAEVRPARPEAQGRRRISAEKSE